MITLRVDFAGVDLYVSGNSIVSTSRRSMLTSVHTRSGVGVKFVAGLVAAR